MEKTKINKTPGQQAWLLCIAAVLLLLLPCAVAAADFTSIATEEQFRMIGTDPAYPLSGSYILESDITLTSDWTPISTFTGTFDGNGHVISDLVITGTGDYIGLFKEISGAEVTDLTLSDVSISNTGQYTGGIAGKSYNSVVDSCHVTGTLTSDNHYLGGIFGQQMGGSSGSDIISNCSVIGNITGAKSYVGGIAGNSNRGAGSSSESTIRDCYFAGNILSTYTGSTAVIGGIVGSTKGSTGTVCISNCYAVGTVEGVKGSGGIIGAAQSITSVVNCVALLSSVTSNYETAPNDLVAPIAGATYAGAEFSGNYALDSMTNGDTLYTEIIPDAKGEYGDYLASSEDVWNTYSSGENTGVWSAFSTENWKPNNGNSDYRLPVLIGQETPVSGDASYLKPESASGQTPPSAAYLKLSSPTEGTIWLINEPVRLSATSAVGDDLTYTWDLGNGDTITGEDVSYVYTTAGSYDITLFVENDAGSASKSTSVVIYDKANPDSELPYTVLYYDMVNITNGSTVVAAISPMSGGYVPGEDSAEIPANSVGGMLDASGFVFDMWKSQKPVPTYILNNITTPDGVFYPIDFGPADLAWRSFDGMTAAAIKYDSNEQLENGTTIYTVYGDHSIVCSDPSGAEYVIVTKLNVVEGPTTWYVGDGEDYTTIQAAVDASSAGDTIIVKAGAYTENVDVDKQLIIRSEDGSDSVIVTAITNETPVFDLNADGIIIEGFSVRGPTNEPIKEHVAGIEIVDFNDCEVRYNDCSGCYNGIHIGNLNQDTATGNIIEQNCCHENNRRGISLRDNVTGNTVFNNTCRNNEDDEICVKDQVPHDNIIWANTFDGTVECLTNNVYHSPEEVTYTYSGTEYTGYVGNYYTGYTGEDGNGDGIGDTPMSYGTYQDDYPMMGTWNNNVIVKPDYVLTIITLSPATAELEENEEWQFSASGFDQHEESMADLTFTWASSNDTVGTVNTTGFFTAGVPGVTTLSATNDVVTGSADITVISTDGLCSVHIIRYAADGTTIAGEATVTTGWMERHLTVYGGENGTELCIQGITNDPNDLWNPEETKNIDKVKKTVRGTSIGDLCDLSGGASECNEIKLTARDGYTSSLPASCLFDPDPRQGEAIIAWWTQEDGYVFEYANGPRLFFMADDGIFGNWDMHECFEEKYWHFFGSDQPAAAGISSKMVATIEIMPESRTDWTLTLNGVISETIDRAAFEHGVVCSNSNHKATWTDGDNLWSGMPLWLLCGWVDDADTHGTFNDALAAAGYTVVITDYGPDGLAGTDDDYSVELASADVARNNAIIVANENNGQALPETGDDSTWPLRLVGGTLTKGQMVSSIDEIQLTNLPEPGVESDMTLSLGDGWNFVSTPKNLAVGNNTVAIFADVDFAGHSVYAYSPADGWQQMTGTDTLSPLDGIWVYSNGTASVPFMFDDADLATPPVKSLTAGWNAVGFSDTIATPAKDALTSVKDDWAILMGFDSGTQAYTTSVINGATGSHADTREMQPGDGYWLFMRADGTLAAISA